jgi:hypothetical protein
MKLNEYFDHVYCLTLPHSHERQVLTMRKANAAGA